MSANLLLRILKVIFSRFIVLQLISVFSKLKTLLILDQQMIAKDRKKTSDLDRMIIEAMQKGQTEERLGSQNRQPSLFPTRQNKEEIKSDNIVDLNGSMISQSYNVPNLTNNDLDVERSYTLDDNHPTETPVLQQFNHQHRILNATLPTQNQSTGKHGQVPVLDLHRAGQKNSLIIPKRRDLTTPSSQNSIPVKTKVTGSASHVEVKSTNGDDRAQHALASVAPIEEQMPPQMLVTAWFISDAIEHSFSYTYQSLIMNRIRFIGTRKLVLMDEKVRSVRPYSLDSDVESEVEQRINKHMRPLLNVLYAKGRYHVYQAASLMNEPGLSTNLTQKTKVDRYFVTNQIKSIAGKASTVVADSKIPQLERALELDDYKHLKKLKAPALPESDEEGEYLDPLYHESQAQGVVLETGDVIRLGRVCYIVKESSIQLAEQALKMCETYAEQKNKKRWDTLIREQTISEVKRFESSAGAYSGEPHSPAQFPEAYDAVEDYFNTALAGAEQANLKGGLEESVNSESKRKSRSFHRLRPAEGGNALHGGLAAPSPQKDGPIARPRANTNEVRIKRDVSMHENKARQKEVIRRLSTRIEALRQHQEEKSCRICFGNDQDGNDESKKTKQSSQKKNKPARVDNPLLAPCSCTGSSRYIHLKCLQEWLARSRYDYDQQDCLTTIYKISSCELCNTKYPDQVNINGERYEIFEIERPQDIPYLVLEVLGMPEAKNIKVIGVPRDKVVTLGRSERNDLMINDQSISNNHSKIFYSSVINKFILQDFQSKYGTLKVIQKPVPIEPGRKVYVQVGCIVLQLQIDDHSQESKRSCWARLCCCLSKLKGSNKEIERKYMKRTLNPKDPIKNEIQLCKSDRTSGTQVKSIGERHSCIQNSNCSYDFTNYPDAIPEECFIYFSRKMQGAGLTQQEQMLNMHFLNKHIQVLEHRAEKDVFMANGFTQRNQRGDDQEEKLKSEILSDYNEFNCINQEAEAIIGQGKTLSTKQTTKITSMRTMAESVLRMKLTPEATKEIAEKTRRRSLVPVKGKSEESSPLDMTNNQRLKAFTSATEPQRSLLRLSSRHHPLTQRLEQIEEELKSIPGHKHQRNQATTKSTMAEEAKKKKRDKKPTSDEDEDEEDEGSSASEGSDSDDLESSESEVDEGKKDNENKNKLYEKEQKATIPAQVAQDIV